MTKQSIPSWETAEYCLAHGDETMALLIDRYGHCRLEADDRPFQALCRSIISQQLAAKAADAIWQRFKQNYDGVPTPGNVLGTERETLRTLGLSGQKIRYIGDLAAKFIAGEITPAAFPAMRDDEIIAQLTAVMGIGAWTAQIFLIFSLGRPDVFPVDDLGLKRALINLYALPNPPAKTDMEKAAERWRPYRSVASWYLWRSLENK